MKASKLTKANAVARGIIKPCYRMNHLNGEYYPDGWVCVANGKSFDTQREALAEHARLHAPIRFE